MNIQLDYSIQRYKLLNFVNPWPFLPDRLGISYILFMLFPRSRCLTAWLCTVMLCSLFSLWFTFFAMQVLWKRLTFRKIKYKRNPTTALNLRDALRWQTNVQSQMRWHGGVLLTFASWMSLHAQRNLYFHLRREKMVKRLVA